MKYTLIFATIIAAISSIIFIIINIDSNVWTIQNILNISHVDPLKYMKISGTMLMNNPTYPGKIIKYDEYQCILNGFYDFSINQSVEVYINLSNFTECVIINKQNFDLKKHSHNGGVIIVIMLFLSMPGIMIFTVICMEYLLSHKKIPTEFEVFNYLKYIYTYIKYDTSKVNVYCRECGKMSRICMNDQIINCNNLGVMCRSCNKSQSTLFLPTCGHIDWCQECLKIHINNSKKLL